MSEPVSMNPPPRMDRRLLLGSMLLTGAGSTAATAHPGRGESPASSFVSITEFGAHERLRDNRSAIEEAFAAARLHGRHVHIPEGTFAFSHIDLRRNDATSPMRMLLSGPGVLRSTTRGFALRASEGVFYDLVIDGLRFESVAGAGTTLIDGDAFRRLVVTPGTQIDGFDWVLRARDYLQSIRILGAIVRGGNGAVVHAPMAYDCTFAHNIIEFVTDGIVIDGQNDPAANGCRISDNVIEGIGGRAIVLGASLGSVVSGNYLENNQGGDIRLDAGTAPHKGLSVRDNSIRMSRKRVADGHYGIVWGRSTALPVRAGGNFCTGPLHDTTGVTALIDMTGDVSQVALYTGYRGEKEPGRAPIGRAFYSDGLGQTLAWFDRYLGFDPHAGEIRFGGQHGSKVGGSEEPPVLTFGRDAPHKTPDAFERKRWAQGSVVFNAAPSPGRAFAWICVASGEPGEWSAMLLPT